MWGVFGVHKERECRRLEIWGGVLVEQRVKAGDVLGRAAGGVLRQGPGQLLGAWGEGEVRWPLCLA